MGHSSLCAAPPLTPGGTPDASRWLYLRALVVRYLSAEDAAMRSSLEPALQVVLGLGAAEQLQISRARAAAAAAGASSSSAGALVAAAVGSMGGSAAAGEAAGGLISSSIGSLGSISMALLSGAGSLLSATGSGVASAMGAAQQQQQPSAPTGQVTLMTRS